MFEDIGVITMNINILKFLGLIFDHNWRRYVCFSVTTFLVFTQFVYMLRTKEHIDDIIRNSYILVLWFNTILRAYQLLWRRERYEQLIRDMVGFYYELKHLKDAYIQELLVNVNHTGKIMARGNLFLGLMTCIGFWFYPIFASNRVLPFGSIIPGIDEYKSPIYEILFVYQVVITPIGCCMYIPYTSLIVAFIMFGIVMCKSLQYRLSKLKYLKKNPAELYREVNECIKYQKAIITYVSTVNNLTTFIFLLEFLAFGVLLCALLFLLVFVDSTGQAIIVYAYITMIFSQILALYWYANELREQNFAIATAAYETEWFTFEISVQKHILLLILRAQKPCSIMLGNTYPMTLELFQSLLNASYTYFTLLKRVYS